MTTTKVSVCVSLAVAGMVALSACGSNNSGGTSNAPSSSASSSASTHSSATASGGSGTVNDGGTSGGGTSGGSGAGANGGGTVNSTAGGGAATEQAPAAGSQGIMPPLTPTTLTTPTLVQPRTVMAAVPRQTRALALTPPITVPPHSSKAARSRTVLATHRLVPMVRLTAAHATII